MMAKKGISLGEHVKNKYNWKLLILIVIIICTSLLYISRTNGSIPPDAFLCGDYYVGTPEHCPSYSTTTLKPIIWSNITYDIYNTINHSNYTAPDYITINVSTSTIKSFCTNKPDGWYCIDDTRQECINGYMGANKDCYYIGIPNNKYPRVKVRGECRETQGLGKAECYKIK